MSRGSSKIIPRPVIAPILIFVALTSCAKPFLLVRPSTLPRRFSYFPTVARLLQIKNVEPSVVPMANFNALMLNRVALSRDAG